MKTKQFFKIMAVLSPIMLSQTFSPAALAEVKSFTQIAKEQMEQRRLEEKAEREQAKVKTKRELQASAKEDADKSIKEALKEIEGEKAEVSVKVEKPEYKRPMPPNEENMAHAPEEMAKHEPPKKPEANEENIKVELGKAKRPPQFKEERVPSSNTTATKPEVKNEGKAEVSERFKIDLNLNQKNFMELKDDTNKYISGIDETLEMLDKAISEHKSDETEFETFDFEALLKEGLELKGDINIAKVKIEKEKIDKLKVPEATHDLADLNMRLELALERIEDYEKLVKVKDAEIAKLKKKHEEEVAKKNRKIKNLEKVSQKKKKKKEKLAEYDEASCKVNSLGNSNDFIKNLMVQQQQTMNMMQMLTTLLMTQMISQNQVSQPSTVDTMGAEFAQNFMLGYKAAGGSTGVNIPSMRDSQERAGNTYNFYGSSSSQAMPGQQGNQQMSSTNPLTQFMQQDFSYNFSMPSQDRYSQMNAQNSIPNYSFNTDITQGFNASQALNQMIWN